MYYSREYPASAEIRVCASRYLSERNCNIIISVTTVKAKLHTAHSTKLFACNTEGIGLVIYYCLPHINLNYANRRERFLDSVELLKFENFVWSPG